MSISLSCQMHIIPFFFNLLLFLVPLAFFPKTSELFEFNKMVLVYVFTVLIAAAWTAEALRNKKIIFKSTPLTIPLLLFLLSQALATIFSIDHRTSLLGYYGRFHGGLLSTICYVILYFAFTTFMDKEKTLKLIKTLLVSTAIAAVYAALEHFGFFLSCLLISGNIDVNCWVQDVQARVFGTFGQPNWLAAWLVAVTPLAWATAIFNFKFSISKKSTVHIFLSVLLFTTLLFTKSRSGLLGFGFAFLIFWLPNIKKHFAVFTLTTIYCLLATIFIWNPFAPSSEPPIEGVTESGDIRKIVWQGALDLWKKYPILGTGVETFAYSYYETRPLTHNLTSEWNFIYNKAHNEYLNFAATTGTVGVVAYILLIASSLRQFSILNFQFPKNRFINLGLLSGYISILVTNFFGFSTVPMALLFFLFPAMAQGLRQESERVKEHKLKKLNNLQIILLSITCSLALLLFYSTFKYWLSDYYFAKGSIKSLEKAVKLTPNEPVYHDKLAQEYAQISPPMASEQLKLALNLSPRNVKILKSAAGVYDDLGEPNNALAIYQKLTLLAPTDAQVWYSLALTQVKLGNLDEAKRILPKVLEMKPDYEKANKLLKYLQ